MQSRSGVESVSRIRLRSLSRLPRSVHGQRGRWPRLRASRPARSPPAPIRRRRGRTKPCSTSRRLARTTRPFRRAIRNAHRFRGEFLREPGRSPLFVSTATSENTLRQIPLFRDACRYSNLPLTNAPRDRAGIPAQGTPRQVPASPSFRSRGSSGWSSMMAPVTVCASTNWRVRDEPIRLLSTPASTG